MVKRIGLTIVEVYVLSCSDWFAKPVPHCAIQIDNLCEGTVSGRNCFGLLAVLSDFHVRVALRGIS